MKRRSNKNSDKKILEQVRNFLSSIIKEADSDEDTKRKEAEKQDLNRALAAAADKTSRVVGKAEQKNKTEDQIRQKASVSASKLTPDSIISNLQRSYNAVLDKIRKGPKDFMLDFDAENLKRSLDNAIEAKKKLDSGMITPTEFHTLIATQGRDPGKETRLQKQAEKQYITSSPVSEDEVQRLYDKYKWKLVIKNDGKIRPISFSSTSAKVDGKEVEFPIDPEIIKSTKTLVRKLFGQIPSSEQERKNIENFFDNQLQKHETIKDIAAEKYKNFTSARFKDLSKDLKMKVKKELADIKGASMSSGKLSSPTVSDDWQNWSILSPALKREVASYYNQKKDEIALKGGKYKGIKQKTFKDMSLSTSTKIPSRAVVATRTEPSTLKKGALPKLSDLDKKLKSKYPNEFDDTEPPKEGRSVGSVGRILKKTYDKIRDNLLYSKEGPQLFNSRVQDLSDEFSIEDPEKVLSKYVTFSQNLSDDPDESEDIIKRMKQVFSDSEIRFIEKLSRVTDPKTTDVRGDEFSAFERNVAPSIYKAMGDTTAERSFKDEPSVGRPMATNKGLRVLAKLYGLDPTYMSAEELVDSVSKIHNDTEQENKSLASEKINSALAKLKDQSPNVYAVEKRRRKFAEEADKDPSMKKKVSAKELKSAFKVPKQKEQEPAELRDFVKNYDERLETIANRYLSGIYNFEEDPLDPAFKKHVIKKMKEIRASKLSPEMRSRYEKAARKNYIKQKAEKQRAMKEIEDLPLESFSFKKFWSKK